MTHQRIQTQIPKKRDQHTAALATTPTAIAKATTLQHDHVATHVAHVCLLQN